MSTLGRKVALNGAALIVGRLGIAVSGAVAVALSSRYLDIEQFGGFVTGMVVVSLLAVFIDLGLNTIAAREMARRPAQAAAITNAVFGLALAGALVMTCIGLIIAHAAYAGAEQAAVRQSIDVLLPVQLFSAAVIAPLNARLIAVQRAWVTVVGEVAGRTVSLAALAAVVLLDRGLGGILAAQASAGLVTASVMVLIARDGHRLSPRIDRALALQLLTWTLPLAGTLVVNQLYFRLDLLLLSALSGARDVALYGLAYKVIEALILLPSYVMVTLLPELARISDQARLRELMLQAVGVMRVLAVGMLLLVGAYAPTLVDLVGGQRYADAALPLQILMVGVAISYQNAPFGHALIARDRQQDLFRLSVLVLVLNLALNVALIPKFGVGGAAAAVVLSEAASFVVVRRLYERTGGRLHEGWGGRIAICGASLAVVLLAFVGVPTSPEPLWAATLGGAVAGALYCLALLRVGALPRSVVALVPSPLDRFARRS